MDLNSLSQSEKIQVHGTVVNVFSKILQMYVVN